MAAKGTEFNFLDLAKRKDPNGKIAKIIEQLEEQNEILMDGYVIEGNLTTGHRSVIRTGLPTATWRKLNQGVPTSKSKTKQVDDTCGMLEAYAEVDKALADLSGDVAAFRATEDMAFLEAMNQEMADTTFYGDTTTNPEEFLGLSERYNALSGADSSDNVIDGAGSGSDNCSIWLIVWGPMTVHYITPKGSKVGFQHRDLGEDTLQDASGDQYQGYRTHYKWDLGLTVRDWRYAVRICNIDVSNLTKDASGSSADLVDLMSQAIEKIRNMGAGRPAFYVNRNTRSFLRRQIKNSNNVHLSMDEVAGKKVISFDGIPVRLCEALLDTESAVT